MKIITLFVLIILSFFTSCSKKQDSYFIDSTIKTFNNKFPERIIFYKPDENNIIKNTKRYKFLNAKELLKNLDEKFFFLSLKNQKDNETIVSIHSYKTGESLSCIFTNNGKLIHKEVLMVKAEPSKPYYIYYEILKRKYPSYMNWDLFPIPQDSLK